MATLWLVVLNAPELETMFVLGLATVSVTTWLVVTHLRTGPPVLARRGYRLLTVPALSAVFGLALSTATGTTFTLQAAAVFVLVWTGWILSVRVLAARYSPFPPVLFVGSTDGLETLRRIAGVEVVHSHVPPERFGPWDTIVVDPNFDRSSEWNSWLVHAGLAGLNVIPAPMAMEAALGRLPLDSLDRRWAHSLFAIPRTYAFLKRCLDLMAVIVLSPVLLLTCSLVALLVWTDCGRPLLFWQERVGKDGRCFRMVKFRTMQPDAEKEGAAFAVKGDPRITRVGAFLRKFRLDELPQFWNVLKGDMSVIGPRPEQRQFVERFANSIPFYSERHKVRPGITGWAQVNNGYAAGEAETREKLSFDLYYIKNLSPLLDLLVILKTVRIVFTGFGAR